ncbi:MAG: hypothetical protein V2I47_04200, partial [Bacteroidales bacterium]|nr:hypothetical protein [Bacteroidales bacterium]
MRKHILSSGKPTIVFAVLFLIANVTFADIVISSGTTMNVSSGTTVVLAGDFTNNGSADLGDGTFVFNDSDLQNVGGTSISEFGNLTINNSGFGIALGQDIRVDGTLTLTSGYLALGASDLTLGEVSSISGTFSSSELIVGAATGVIRKEFADDTGANPDSFLFPIGDLSYNYTPISIDFSTGDFSSAYVEINVHNAKEPSNTSIDSYLNRYWEIYTFGITDYLYDATATYVDGDIVGTEADISGALYTGT